MQKSKPKAVLISDVHYTPVTLHLAHAAMTQALRLAEELNVPLVDCGDILDSKSVIRAECANALIELFKYAKTSVYLLVGNHTLLNEKGAAHALNFLKPYCNVVDDPQWLTGAGLFMVPYRSSPEQFLEDIKYISTYTTIIAHQGFQGAKMGHYVIDKGAVPLAAVSGYKIISGHYHQYQTLSAPKKGSITYVGTPYTISFSEANDGPKGFRILYDDGSLEFVKTALRKHVIVERNVHTILQPIPDLNPEDLLWLKVSGLFSELESLNKEEIAKAIGHDEFRLDKIATDSSKPLIAAIETKPHAQILDELIDASAESEDEKAYLKDLWRKIT